MVFARRPLPDHRRPYAVILSRYTELNADQKSLVKHLKLDLPSQPPPRITAPAEKPARRAVAEQV